MNRVGQPGTELGELPHFVNCALCALPRRLAVPVCPFCGTETVSGETASLPEDFTLRLVAEARWDAAAAYLESETAAGRETAASCLLLGWISFITYDLRAVEIWCHESLRLAHAAGPHLLLGHVLQTAGRWEEALSEYRHALDAGLPPAAEALTLERLSYCQSQIPEW